MKKILLVDDNFDFIDIVGMVIEGYFENPYIICNSGNEAIDLLKTDPNIGLIISDYNMPNGNGLDVFNYNLSAENYPFILLTSEEFEECHGMESLIQVNNLNQKLKKPFNYKLLVKALSRILGDSSDSSDSDIQILTRISLKKLKSYFYSEIDYYLSEDGNSEDIIFVKGSRPAINEIENYQLDGYEFVYVKPEDYTTYLTSYISEIEIRLQQVDNFGAKLNLNAEIIATLREVARFVGLSQDQIQKALKSMNNSIDTLRKNSDLTRYLDEVLKGHGYLIAHSFICGQLSYVILEKMQLLSAQNLAKLQAASLLQDISLPSSLFAEVMDIDSQKYKSLSKSAQEMIWSHGQDSASIAAMVKGLDPEIQDVIINHHEKADGSGFPKGVDGHSLTEFDAMFILINRLSHFLFFCSKDPDTVAWYKTCLNENFNVGKFERPLKAVISILT